MKEQTCFDCRNLKTGWLGNTYCKAKKHHVENSTAASCHGAKCKRFAAIVGCLCVLVLPLVAAQQIERHPENAASNRQRNSASSIATQGKITAANARKAANAAQNVPELRLAVADLAATVSNLCTAVESLVLQAR